jgi:hypothetical protein
MSDPVIQRNPPQTYPHVNIEPPVVVLPHRACDRRPGVLEHQHALDVVALKLLARDRVEQRRLDAQERHRRRAGLALDRTRQRRDDDAAGLGLEEGVDDGGLLAPDVVVEPVPRLRVDRLADAPDDAQRAEVRVLHVLLAEPAEEADGGGRSVEVRDLVAVDRLPEAGRCRVDWGRLEDGGGNAVGERTVDDVAVKE